MSYRKISTNLKPEECKNIISYQLLESFVVTDNIQENAWMVIWVKNLTSLDISDRETVPIHTVDFQ